MFVLCAHFGVAFLLVLVCVFKLCVQGCCLGLVVISSCDVFCCIVVRLRVRVFVYLDNVHCFCVPIVVGD